MWEGSQGKEDSQNYARVASRGKRQPKVYQRGVKKDDKTPEYIRGESR